MAKIGRLPCTGQVPKTTALNRNTPRPTTASPSGAQTTGAATSASTGSTWRTHHVRTLHPGHHRARPRQQALRRPLLGRLLVPGRTAQVLLHPPRRTAHPSKGLVIPHSLLPGAKRPFTRMRHDLAFLEAHWSGLFQDLQPPVVLDIAEQRFGDPDP